MKGLVSASLLTALLLPGLVLAQGQEPEPEWEWPEGFGWGSDAEPDDEPPKASADASTPEFKRALELQEKKRWKAAQKALRDLLEKYPESVHKASAEARSDDNAFLGIEVIHNSGPPERRIDVTVMGDGFTLDDTDQKLQQDWAKLCLTVLWSEAVYAEYKSYFNYYFVRLASLEEGVDPSLSPEEKAKIEARNKSRTRKRKTEFSTALDCKEAGPQGQVLADRNLVFKWLRIAGREVPGCEDDRLVIAFARFGKLGMAGGGIANVGRPDKSVTVHEFGHSFVGLLDEYSNNPGRPFEPIRAPNASTESDPEKVPWAHFLKKKVPGVGVFKGGATYYEGVWKPAKSCAMNSAGHQNYCPVCREAAVLKIYSYVDPIDAYDPPTTQEIEINVGDQKFLAVTPMKPASKSLDVGWFVEKIEPTEAMPESGADSRATGSPRRNRIRDALFGRGGGPRAAGDRSAYDKEPAGDKSPLGTTRKRRGGAVENVFALGRLSPGRYRVTVAVTDRSPYVYADPSHLLEERKTWWVKVVKPAAAK